MSNTWKEVETKQYDEYFVTENNTKNRFRITGNGIHHDEFILEGINNSLEFNVERRWILTLYTPTLYTQSSAINYITINTSGDPIDFGDLSKVKSDLGCILDKHDITNCDIKGVSVKEKICTCGGKKALTTHAFWCDSIVKEDK